MARLVTIEREEWQKESSAVAASIEVTDRPVISAEEFLRRWREGRQSEVFDFGIGLDERIPPPLPKSSGGTRARHRQKSKRELRGTLRRKGRH